MRLDNLYIKDVYLDDTQMTSIDLDAERFMFVSRDYIKTNKRTIKFDGYLDLFKEELKKRREDKKIWTQF